MRTQTCDNRGGDWSDAAASQGPGAPRCWAGREDAALRDPGVQARGDADSVPASRHARSPGRRGVPLLLASVLRPATPGCHGTHPSPLPAVSAHTRPLSPRSPRDTRTRSSRGCCSSSRGSSRRLSLPASTRPRLQGDAPPSVLHLVTPASQVPGSSLAHRRTLIRPPERERGGRTQVWTRPLRGRQRPARQPPSRRQRAAAGPAPDPGGPDIQPQASAPGLERWGACPAPASASHETPGARGGA